MTVGWGQGWYRHSYSGGSFSKWMFKASGLYQLPYGFNVSFFFNAREGFKVDETFQFRNYISGRNTRDYTQTIYIQPDNAETLPTFYKLDLRVEKLVNVSDIGRIFLMVDIFNVFKKSITFDRNNKYWGRYYYYGEGHSKTRFRTEPYPYDITDILSPFIARFGIRFEF